MQETDTPRVFSGDGHAVCLAQRRFLRQEQARCPLHDAAPHVAIFP